MNVRQLRRAASSIFVATLLIGSVGFAQQDAPKNEAQEQSWADEIGPNDVRVLGTVAEVRDETFTLRSHDQGTFIFEIPSDPEQEADVRTGKDVQVWYDPAGYERDGDTWYRASRVESTDQSRIAEASETSETSTLDDENAEMGSSADLEANENDVDADVDATVAEDGRTYDDELDDEESYDESESDVGIAEQNQADRDESFADETDDDQDERALPQTAGSLPLLAVLGLVSLLTAGALRIRS